MFKDPTITHESDEKSDLDGDLMLHQAHFRQLILQQDVTSVKPHCVKSVLLAKSQLQRPHSA